LLESLGSGTRLTLVTDVELRSVYRPIALLVKRVTRRQFEAQLLTLKELLESRSS